MKALAFALFLLLPSMAAEAADAYVLSAGYGDDTSQLQASMVWHWDRQWFTEGDWHLTGYWEADAGLWKGSSHAGKYLGDVGFLPVFRLRPNASGGTQPYWEAGVGPHIVTDNHVDAGRDLGGNVLISEQLGFGITFGEKTRYDVGYRLQHMSSLGVKSPDDGITLHQIRLTYLY